MTSSTRSAPVPYFAPAITDDSREFWTAGARNELRICRCGDCGYYLHPPVPVCRACRSMNVAAQTVSGRGTLASFTVNHQAWSEGFSGPYILGLVEIAEQKGVNLITNIVDCALEEVRVGMPVQVAFEPVEDAWLPVFRPA
ncbi:MAG: hypothetical protein JWQ90_2527 [Hydrocarboniphaga sp.]|uniref:Zn-ribbon domain-containing OB-fold protein n=1 Tax=Hydrocarboniphaga sp. TaxID=2033016 RepID=UPI00261340AF|nr:OB-fold domain-containing protein [Hydrocarboniphaga sp.]MDB5970077.1 hypothetical protein [Hydrocarboniphaga sp.]